MKPGVKNILAVIAGAILGSAVNMGIIVVSGSIIPPPDGSDITTMDGLKASMHLFQPKHFVFPFLAHALGTFAGAFLAAKMADTNKLGIAFLIGLIFLAGGIANVFMLPSPTWFSLLDLLGAYLPMSFLAGKLAIKKKSA